MREAISFCEHFAGVGPMSYGAVVAGKFTPEPILFQYKYDHKFQTVSRRQHLGIERQ